MRPDPVAPFFMLPEECAGGNSAGAEGGAGNACFELWPTRFAILKEELEHPVPGYFCCKSGSSCRLALAVSLVLQQLRCDLTFPACWPDTSLLKPSSANQSGPNNISGPKYGLYSNCGDVEPAPKLALTCLCDAQGVGAAWTVTPRTASFTLTIDTSLQVSLLACWARLSGDPHSDGRSLQTRLCCDAAQGGYSRAFAPIESWYGCIFIVLVLLKSGCEAFECQFHPSTPFFLTA